MSYWIKNTKGEPSASLTLVMVSFTVIILWMTLSIFVNPFGIQTVPFNATEAMIVLSPLLATYFGRRYTEQQQELPQNKSKNKDINNSEE